MIQIMKEILVIKNRRQEEKKNYSKISRCGKGCVVCERRKGKRRSWRESSFFEVSQSWQKTAAEQCQGRLSSIRRRVRCLAVAEARRRVDAHDARVYAQHQRVIQQNNEQLRFIESLSNTA